MTRFVRFAAFRRVLRKLVLSGAPDLSSLVPRLPKPSAREVTISPEQFAELLPAASLPLRMMLLLCHDCALRASAAIRFCPAQYDATEQVVRLRTKFGRAVTVPVTPRLAALLALVTHAPADSTVPYIKLLTGPRGYSYTTLQNEWQEVRERHGIAHVRFHDLRRSMAVNVLKVTADLRLVQALLGHNDLSATFHYLDHDIGHASVAQLTSAAYAKETK